MSIISIIDLLRRSNHGDTETRGPFFLSQREVSVTQWFKAISSYSNHAPFAVLGERFTIDAPPGTAVGANNNLYAPFAVPAKD
jgi:hypothetical protein